LGAAALLVAGGPFWLTDLKLGLTFPNDRFHLSFMLGASLFAAALLWLIPVPARLRIVLFGAAVGFAVATQFQFSIAYRDDWAKQRSLMWQMVWRMPDLAPGTTLISNELPIRHYSDNSLTAALNWAYDPLSAYETMPYALQYPTVRKDGLLANYHHNQPILYDYLATTFHGNTSQAVVLYYNPPGCLRVLDPEIERGNWMLPRYLREAIALSSTAPILPAPAEGKPAPRPPAHIYGKEIERGWCYYYLKADLARQQNDWASVAALGDQGFALGDYPNDPAERLPFIEGYAHTGNWERALELSRETRAITSLMQPVLCPLWDRIARETEPGETQQQALQTIQAELECGPKN
jgi:hypothetical protein